MGRHMMLAQMTYGVIFERHTLPILSWIPPWQLWLNNTLDWFVCIQSHRQRAVCMCSETEPGNRSVESRLTSA